MMIPLRRLSSCGILCGCLALSGALYAEARGFDATAHAGEGKLAINADLPPIDLAAYNGLVANSRGKALMVTFWATWCEPCRDEFPRIEELAKKYRSQGLTVIGVNLDEGSNANLARQFLTQAHADFPNFRVKQGIDFDNFYQGVRPDWQGTMPQTIFYGRDGHVARYLVGAHPPTAFEDAIRLILVSSAPDNDRSK